MSSIEIKKAKIKNGIFLAYEYVEKTQDHENKISTSSDAPIHDDLRSAFDALAGHFTLLTEQLSSDLVEDAIIHRDQLECLGNYSVMGFTIGGTGDSEGVVISGYKKLQSGGVVNFNTPFQKFDDEDYAYSGELYDAIRTLKTEVYEYMEGKQAPKMRVGELEFGDEDEAFAMDDVDVDIEIMKQELD